MFGIILLLDLRLLISFMISIIKFLSFSNFSSLTNNTFHHSASIKSQLNHSLL